MKLMILRIYLIIIATFFFIVPAFAYLDPGTGSMLLQGLIGAIAASIAIVSMYYHRLKAFLFKKFPKLDKNQKHSK